MVPATAAAELGRFVVNNMISIIALWIAVFAAAVAINVYQRPGFTCARGIAVMTPDGYATTVCAP